MIYVSKFEDDYQEALKFEEKLARNKANETKEEIQAEVRKPVERSLRNQRMKLENNIVNLRKVEVLRKDNMEEEDLFLEEEEELEEVKLDVMSVER
jgi:hypothetical protein